jgi:hypothetical protein
MADSEISAMIMSLKGLDLFGLLVCILYRDSVRFQAVFSLCSTVIHKLGEGCTNDE